MSKSKSSRRVSIVVVTQNRLSCTKACLDAIRETANDYELILVDNASTDGTGEYLRLEESRNNRLEVVRNAENAGFAGACNQGVALAKYGLVCLLHNDVVPRPGWLDALRNAMRQGVGAVGAKLVMADHTIEHAGIVFQYREEPGPHFLPFYRYVTFPEEILDADHMEEMPAVSGACLLTSKSAWGQVGGMDVAYGMSDFEDVDLCLRLREAGLSAVYQPAAVLMHYGGRLLRTGGTQQQDRQDCLQSNYQQLMEKWYQKLCSGLVAAG